MTDEDFKKYYRKNLAFKSAKKRRLNEGETWENRKSGGPLPTMKDYKEAYDKKSLREDDIPVASGNDYYFKSDDIDAERAKTNILVQPIPSAVKIFDLIDGTIDEFETEEEEVQLLDNIIHYMKKRMEALGDFIEEDINEESAADTANRNEYGCLPKEWEALSSMEQYAAMDQRNGICG